MVWILKKIHNYEHNYEQYIIMNRQLAIAVAKVKKKYKQTACSCQNEK
jgi:hypothetical protein